MGIHGKRILFQVRMVILIQINGWCNMLFYGSYDLTSMSAGQKIIIPLYDMTGFVIQSAHPQYFKSPAHMVYRNMSPADLEIYSDTGGYLHSLGQNTTTVIPILPPDSYHYLEIYNSVSTNGSPEGQSNTLFVNMYYPGEPLQHPLGR
jgi:hypothetical protein